MNTIAKALAGTAIIITLTIGSCCAHVDYRISKAIEKGADPIAARLAFSNDGTMAERITYILEGKRAKEDQDAQR